MFTETRGQVSLLNDHFADRWYKAELPLSLNNTRQASKEEHPRRRAGKKSSSAQAKNFSTDTRFQYQARLDVFARTISRHRLPPSLPRKRVSRVSLSAPVPNPAFRRCVRTTPREHRFIKSGVKFTFPIEAKTFGESDFDLTLRELAE